MLDPLLYRLGTLNVSAACYEDISNNRAAESYLPHARHRRLYNNNTIIQLLIATTLYTFQ